MHVYLRSYQSGFLWRVAKHYEKVGNMATKGARRSEERLGFLQIFTLHENGLGYSARVIHIFLCRELITFKNLELISLCEAPLQFSLQKFHLVNRLERNTSLSLKKVNDWEDDGGF
ncbi:hypothetical protein Bca52824_064897 [Brassica carinata]|uniref:Uncharacterized protein n=1 Tax=Brassica carinata TaxID=52824 RepID=A0A8X7QJA5_BRACI|nr:hypothetical protein Bca52824_064897 [Brassica carinata]